MNTNKIWCLAHLSLFLALYVVGLQVSAYIGYSYIFVMAINGIIGVMYLHRK